MVQPLLNKLVQGVRGGELPRFAAAALLAINVLGIASLPASAATRSEKTFGNWRVVCVEPDNEPKRCSMAQTQVQINKQSNTRRLVLAWSVSANKNHELTQALTVPAGVSIKEGVRLFLGESEQPSTIAYSVCGPRICIAEAPLDAKTISAIKTSKKASASYVLGSKQLVQTELDLNGFGQAYDYLSQQL